jgi:hypothetical protein
MPRFQKTKPEALPNTFVHARGWLRDRVVIHRQEGATGVQPVFVQLNNFACLIPREVECELTKPIVQVLKEAIQTPSFKDEKGETYTRDVQRFNFTVKQENINWDEIMSDPEFAPMNEDFLRGIGQWADTPAQEEAG